MKLKNLIVFKNWKMALMVLTLIILMVLCQFQIACEVPTSPVDPDKPLYTEHKLKIIYKRTVITNPKSVDMTTVLLAPNSDKYLIATFRYNEGTLKKIDDMTYETPLVVVRNNDYKNAKKHCVWAVDLQRSDGTASSCIVGTDFYIEGPKNKIQLTNIVKNIFYDEGGQMAQFTLSVDGVLSN